MNKVNIPTKEQMELGRYKILSIYVAGDIMKAKVSLDSIALAEKCMQELEHHINHSCARSWHVEDIQKRISFVITEDNYETVKLTVAVLLNVI